MNLIFMRHGEATDNVKELISDKEIYWSVLTEEGIKTVKDSLNSLETKINKIYVSPFPRTIETAHFAYEKYKDAEVIIDKRLHEIYYGKNSGKKNNEELDEIRKKQIDGDYFTRFGEYGENKYQIEERLCDFLNEVKTNNINDNTIMIVSHGSITSYMKRLLNLKSPHIKTGKIEIFENVDYTYLYKYIIKMNKIKKNETKTQKEIINNLDINNALKKNIKKIINEEFNNVDITKENIDNYLEGLNTNKLLKLNDSKLTNDIIAISFFENNEEIAEKWINHYINIGVKNFALVNNNSCDKTYELLNKYKEKVNIEFWRTNETLNSYTQCGLKQKLLEHYGKRKYLLVDFNELFIYPNYKEKSINEYLNNANTNSNTKNKKINFNLNKANIKSIILDVYSKDNYIYQGKFEEYKYVDKGTYTMDNSVSYKAKIIGGPKKRLFNNKSSMQKISIINYTGKEVYINNHFYYPWEINKESILNTYLLHYNLLQSDAKTYYDKEVSILIDDIKFEF